MIELSVVICTHNPRKDYFDLVLDALRAQTLAPSRWELIVVDNLSNDPLEGRVDLSWQPGARIIREEKLGLTPARLCGIANAASELLVFVDDDNVLDADYLERALEISRGRPWLGAWSGQCRGEFEKSPPEWTRRYWGSLAVREFDQEVWSNLPRLPETMPCGAGLVVRRSVALHYLAINNEGKRTIQLDRTGDSLLSGGDNDLAGCACALGLGVGLTPSLKLRHMISPARLTKDYLTRLAFGIHYSSVLLDAEHGKIHPPRSRLGRLVDWLRCMRLSEPHRAILKAAQAGEQAAGQALDRKK